VNGLADRTGPDNGAVLQVLKNGTYVSAGAGTVVQGLYGQLTIDATGKYTYNPSGAVASVGKVEDFQYQLVHPNGLTSSAHLYVRIDSANVTEVWNPNNLAANATLVDAVNDTATSALSLVGQFTDSTATLGSYASGTLGGRGEFTFSVAPNTSSDLTLSVTGSGLSLLSPVNFVLSKLQANGSYVQVGAYSGANLIAVGSAGLGVRVEDQTAGTYRLTITNGGLGVSSSYTASVRQEATSTNTFVVGSATTATGNLLTGAGADVVGSPYTSLSVLSAGAFVLPGVNGVSIAGAHGSLLVNADGSYAYTPTLNQSGTAVGQSDVFTYQLNHPTGASDTATLTINLSNAAAPTSFARLASFDSDDASAVHVAAAGSDLHDQQGTSADDVLDGAQGGALTLQGHEGNDTLVIYDQAFASVDGGAGIDTLKWNGGDADIDLSNLAARINNIEVIDLNQSSKVNLTLSLSDLLSVTDASTDKLLILGDSHDTVHMTGATWAPGAIQTDNGVQYNVYTAQEDPSHHLWVQSGISVV
jgi:VCBS repeat-containing protein